MSGLADLLPKGGKNNARFRSARVISVTGSTLTVDIGGGVVVSALESCNPVPDQTVLLVGYGSSWAAVGVLGGTYKQSTLTAISSTSTTVTGLLNGVSATVPKTSSATVTIGDVLPLLWSADGSRAWAITKEQAATVAPPESGGGATSASGGGSGSGSTSSIPKSGTAFYVPTSLHEYNPTSGSWGGTTSQIRKASHGAFFYGARRFQELQGRTITSCLVKISGGSTRTFSRHNLAVPSGAPTLNSIGLKYTSGWVDLGASAGAALVAAGTAGLYVNAGGSDISGGRLQIGWRM